MERAKPFPIEEKNTSIKETELPDYISMYDISGQDKITGQSFRRYVRDKEQDQKIIDRIKYKVDNLTVAYERKIKNAPKAARAELIMAGLNEKDKSAQRLCVIYIYIAPENAQAGLREKVTELIMAGLNEKDVEVQKSYADMINFATEADRADLIQTGLAKKDVGVQKACAEMIYYAPEADRIDLREKVVELIQAGLDKEDPVDQRIYVMMIQYAPIDARKGLFQLAREKAGNFLVEPPLYRNKEVSEDKFQRVKFPKTGSETTLIGGQLKNKTIIRHLKPEAFFAWQKLYEDHEMWKQKGFDYVPIEPIQSYILNKKGLVDVFSGVLDLSLNAWKEMDGDFQTGLNEDRLKIIAILEKQGVNHGHTHEDNFCLRFFRDEKGNVDFSRKPRIYLIDFDMATSP